MQKNYSEKTLYDILGTELEDNEVIDAGFEGAYEKIRQIGSMKKRKTGMRKHGKAAVWKKAFVAVGGMAAVLCVMLTFCVMNPVMAREIPILGSIFARVADVYPFGKLPEEHTAIFSEEEGLVSTDNGITISVTQEYASNQAVYIGVKVVNEQEFPEMVATIESGQQFIKARTLEDYSFCPGQRRNRRYLEGKFVDAHTFLGIIRIDYDDIRRMMEEADMLKDTVEIPESFTVKLEIMEIAGTLKDAELPAQLAVSDEEFEQMTQEEQTAYFDSIPKAWYGLEYQSWHQEGTWCFTLPVVQTDGNVRRVEVNQFNADGIGVESIEVSSMEISVNSVIPDEADVMMAVFDAQGRQIPYSNSSNAGFALLTSGYDIKNIYIYFYDTIMYFNLLEQYEEEPSINIGLQDDGERLGQAGTDQEKEFQKALEEITEFRTAIKIPE